MVTKPLADDRDGKFPHIGDGEVEEPRRRRSAPTTSGCAAQADPGADDLDC
jgi:hypothetical protein